MKKKFVGNGSLRICTAEDLIVLKAFANRTQDWADIEGVIKRQDNLDLNFVVASLAPLAKLKENLEIVNRLKDLFERRDNL